MAIEGVFDTRSLGFTSLRRPTGTVASPTRTLPDNSGVTAPTSADVAGTLPISAFGLGDLIDIGISVRDKFRENRVPTGGLVGGCPPPLEFDPNLGFCILPGSPGEIQVQDITDRPGLKDVSLGIFGLLSAQPMVIGEIRGRPVLRCPHPGLVLGKDDRCYSKKDLPSKLRKWPPHKCVSSTDRKIKAIKAAGAAAKSLTATFKGSGFKISRNK